MWQKLRENFQKDGSMPGIVGAKGRQDARKRLAEEPHANTRADLVSRHQCRTCVGDDAILQWVADHPDGCNLVILGAGYDTRLYRLELPASSQLFEIDAAGTQEEKLRIMTPISSELTNQSQVTYVGVHTRHDVKGASDAPERNAAASEGDRH